MIVVINKVDLCPGETVAGGALDAEILEEAVSTCAMTGLGVAELREAILGRLEVMPGGRDSAVLTNLARLHRKS